MSAGPRRLVIVGASLAGLRAAEALRAQGYDADLTLVGDESHPPYDRPPLSKQSLTCEAPPPAAYLPVPGDLGARWLLGRPAVRLDPAARVLTLADGGRLPYDGLLIATGSAARGWPGARRLPRGVHTLRSHADALAVRGALGTGRRLVVVGAGFLGGEIAASARARGVHVTLVEAADQPLLGAVGPAVGRYVAALHREAGVDLRTGVTVTRFHAADGGLTGVRLSDGSEVPAQAAVLALGAAPATGWLRGAGLDVEAGVRCDPYLRALRPDGGVVPGVVAAGDVARVPQALAGGTPLSLGHWSNAVEQGAHSAHTLLHGDDGGARPFTAVPSFWSDLHGARIRSVGLPAVADEARVHEHDVPGGKLEVGYHRAGELVGALAIGRTGRLVDYRRRLEDSTASHAAV